MSESKQENEDEVGLQNISTVQVLIEPATPRKDEGDDCHDNVHDENKIAEDSYKVDENKITEDSVKDSADEVNTNADGAMQDGVIVMQDDVTVADEASPEADASVNQNNNEDSTDKDKEVGEDTRRAPSAQSDPGENSKEHGSEKDNGNEDPGMTAGPADSNNVVENPSVKEESAAPHADVEQTTKDQNEENDESIANIENGTGERGAEQTSEDSSRTLPNVDITIDEKKEQPTLAIESETQSSGDISSQGESVSVPTNDSIDGETKALNDDETSGQKVAVHVEEAVENEEEKQSEDFKSHDRVDREESPQVTTDIVTEDISGKSKDQNASEGSVAESERPPKTPESIAASVDLPDHMAVPSPTKGRPVTGDSNYSYNDQDFMTPDYEMYGPTPVNAEGEPLRSQLSPSKRDRQLASRGDSTKSVTFADDVSRESEKGNDNDDSEQSHATPSVDGEEEGKESEEQSKDEEENDGEEGYSDEDEEKRAEAEEALDIFPTAVSNEKLEEAKKKQEEKEDNFTRKESLAIELFGASKFEPESMEDVITKKAYEHFELGCNLAERGDFCQSVLSFDKAINLLPKEVKFYLMRGEAYLQLCDFQSAILNMKKACVLQPSNSDYYSRLAFVYYFQGQSLFDQCLFAEALESFSRAAEMKPEIIAYHTRSIACLAALQRHGECLALVNKRLEMERNSADLFIMRARLHQLFRNSTLCYYDLKDALALSPEQEEANTLMRQLEVKAEESRNHATRLQLQGKFKDSLNKITIAIEMNPSIPEYHLQRGALQKRLHDYNAAIDDFLLAMDKTEHDERSDVYTNAQRQLLLTYNDFAVECFMGGHFEEAILLLNKALKGEKREKGLYINRGDCFYRLQELHFALADYHQALEVDPGDAAIRSRVAAIHAQFGLQDYEEHSYQDAEARYTVALQNNPRHGPYYIARCKVRLMMENQTGARQDFLMGMHLDPSNTDILTLMPRLYPGKSVADVMRTKQAKEAKVAANNAVMTASPIKLPGLQSADAAGGEGEGADGGKRVTFDPGLTQGQNTVMPPLKACMDEIEFNKILTKEKKKISNKVKTMLNDRGTLFVKDRPKLVPQPPVRPFQIQGGQWKNPAPQVKPGWRTFSLGVGLME